MAEVVGVVASVINIVAAAKTCLDLYEIIETGRHATKDLDNFAASVRVQRVNFQNWCEYVGLASLIHANNQTVASTTLTFDEIKTHVIPSILDKRSREAIVLCLDRIVTAFEEARIVINSHTAQKPGAPSAWQFGWLRPRERVQTAGPPIPLDDSLGIAANGSDLRVAKTSIMKWILSHRRKLELLLTELRHLNADLTDILNWNERNQFLRLNQLQATTTSHGNVIMRASSTTSGSLALEEDVRELVGLFQRSVGLQTGEVDDDSLLHRLPHEEPSQDMYLLEGDFDLPLQGRNQPQTRVKTSFRRRPALIEWKYYSRMIDGPMLQALRRRVTLLNLQLQQSSRIHGFNVLNCVGHFHDENNRRFGIAFQLPDESELAEIVSLQDRMLQDRRNRQVRELGSRLNVAKALALTFFRLHSVAWLHKNFNSENVIFFEALTGSLNGNGLPKPYVCGFDFSRKDVPNEISERMPSVLHSQRGKRALMMYRHPDARQTSQESHMTSQTSQRDEKTRYKKAYDLFSLGMVLLEIGLWRPMKDLLRQGESYADFSKRLHAELVPELQYRMGQKYYEVVKQCLEGDFDEKSSTTTATLGDGDDNAQASVHARANRTWLVNFERDVVKKLETCSL